MPGKVRVSYLRSSLMTMDACKTSLTSIFRDNRTILTGWAFYINTLPNVPNDISLLLFDLSSN